MKNSKYYKEYKICKKEYLQLKKQIGGNITFYHGSPHKLEVIKQRTPRGTDIFDSQKGVYVTDDIMHAKIYAIARDPDRNNRDWAVVPYPEKDSEFHLLLNKKLWKNTSTNKLNNIGYLHIIEINTSDEDVEQHPDRETEYIIKRDVIPKNIITVTKEDIRDNIIYLSDNEIKEHMKLLTN